jgi:hypothetical protein
MISFLTTYILNISFFVLLKKKYKVVSYIVRDFLQSFRNIILKYIYRSISDFLNYMLYEI